MIRARAMTLMETLVAVTILASLTAIVASLWAQTRSWTEEASAHDAPLRLQRAVDMLDGQWQRRITSADIPGGAPAQTIVAGDRIRFVTTDGVLFPNWPYIRAAYIAHSSTDPEGNERWRLDYEEVRLGSTHTGAHDTSIGDREFTPDEADVRRVTLLDLTSRPLFSAVLNESQIQDLLGEEDPPQPSGEKPDETDDAETDESTGRWIGLTEHRDRRWAGLEEAINPDAARLDCETAEGELRWALAGLPSR